MWCQNIMGYFYDVLYVKAVIGICRIGLNCKSVEHCKQAEHESTVTGSIDEVRIWQDTRGTQYTLAVAACLLLLFFAFTLESPLYSICLYCDLICFISVHMLLKFLVHIYLGVAAYFCLRFVYLSQFVLLFSTHSLFVSAIDSSCVNCFVLYKVTNLRIEVLYDPCFDDR